jgi:Cu(I)/Ag(I) efflux system membrane fusion protein
MVANRGRLHDAADSRLRVAAVTAAVVVVALGALLLLQDFRHGWPFSRHHATPGERASQPIAAAVTGQVSHAPARSPVEVDSARLEALGVRFEPVAVEVIAQPVRAVATVVADEARISHVHTRVSGWLEQLFVNTTGQQVRAGEPLAAVFSQELYASQNEYLSLLRLAQDAPRTAALEAGRTRLELLGMSAAEIAEIERTGQARRLVTIISPHGGVVLRRGVSVGTTVDPSTEIVTLADLSVVWVLAEVPQSDLARLAQAATREFLPPARPVHGARRSCLSDAD